MRGAGGEGAPNFRRTWIQSVSVPVFGCIVPDRRGFSRTERRFLSMSVLVVWWTDGRQLSGWHAGLRSKTEERSGWSLRFGPGVGWRKRSQQRIGAELDRSVVRCRWTGLVVGIEPRGDCVEVSDRLSVIGKTGDKFKQVREFKKFSSSSNGFLSVAQWV